MRVFSVVGAIFNFVSLGLITAGLMLIKRWIKHSFDGIRRWRWSVDGLFLIYLLFLLVISVIDLALLYKFYSNDLSDFVYEI